MYEDEGKEEGIPTPEGEWDEGEQGPGGRGELEEENGVGVVTKGAATETLALGLQGRGTEVITPSERNGARKLIQRSVIGRRETSTIELWKATRS